MPRNVGPGACNLVTGIATAYMDSVPIVAITGQVPTTMLGNDAFQESDITGITMPVTKHNYLVKDDRRDQQGGAGGVLYRRHGQARAGPYRSPKGCQHPVCKRCRACRTKWSSGAITRPTRATSGRSTRPSSSSSKPSARLSMPAAGSSRPMHRPN